MSNQLKMANVQAILSLWERGWSFRRIARELGVHRDTVAHYVRQAAAASKPADPPAGYEPKPADLPTGSGPKPANLPAGSQGPPSRCEPYRDFILESLEKGLSCQRIYQDLVSDHGFEAGYDSVKRFARGLRSGHDLPFRRMECGPGEEAQVDFGSGYYVLNSEGRRRLTHVFRIVLSHSRKGYSEAVFRQSTEEFIRCLENAFHYFGGVPQTLVIDNLRAAVTKADWYDPELNPKLQAFSEHYGVAILPTRPYTPRHKGKIEKGIEYVKNNALKGRVFGSLAELNRHLAEWEDSVADTRIHGTTRKQVGKVFEAEERGSLKPLPRDRFPFFHEAERSVHRDGHVEVAKAYYSAPAEYLGRRVWVRWDSRVVRIFNQRMEQVAIHVKVEPGRFSTVHEHIVSQKISGVEQGAAYHLKRASRIGPQTAGWCEAMLAERGVQGVRVLIGLLRLANSHSSQQIERACETALSYRVFNLGSLRELLKRQAPKQESFEFIEQHPIIRSLEEYEELVRNVFSTE